MSFVDEFLAGLSGQPSPGLGRLSAEYMAGAPAGATGADLANYLAQSPIPTQANTGINYLLEKAGAEARLSDQAARDRQARALYSKVATETGDTNEAYRAMQMQYPGIASEYSNLAPTTKEQNIRAWENLPPEKKNDPIYREAYLGSGGVTIHNAPQTHPLAGKVMTREEKIAEGYDPDLVLRRDKFGIPEKAPAMSGQEVQNRAKIEGIQQGIANVTTLLQHPAFSEQNMDQFNSTLLQFIAREGWKGDIAEGLAKAFNKPEHFEVYSAYIGNMKRLVSSMRALESGAEVPEREFIREMSVYGPSMHDTPALRELKLQMAMDRYNTLINIADPEQRARAANMQAEIDQVRLDQARKREGVRSPETVKPHKPFPHKNTPTPKPQTVTSAQPMSIFDFEPDEKPTSVFTRSGGQEVTLDDARQMADQMDASPMTIWDGIQSGDMDW